MEVKNLSNLAPAEGSTKKVYRKGRGPASGNGHKGQNARSGGGVRLGFEGGQLPLYRKLPKRGFNNRFAKEYNVINLGRLEQFEDGTVVDLDLLVAAGVVRTHAKNGLKVLGGGEFTKKLTVKAAVFSATAKEKITAAGGQAEEG